MARLEHLRYRRFLDAYVDDELSGALAIRVATHVVRCPVCRPEARLTFDIKWSLAATGHGGTGGQATIS